MHMHTTVFAVFAALALAFAGSAGAQESPLRLEEESDKFVLENEHVTVWFQGKKPMLKVFPTGNESAGYLYKFRQVVEYRDLDADGVPAPQEIVSSLSLEKASQWEVEQAELDGAVVLNLTLVADVKLGAGELVPEGVTLPDRQAEISLVFTLREGNVTLEVGDANVTVPETSVKYDFLVHSWPFVDASANRLALDLHVEGELEEVEVDGVEGATLSANGTAIGALSWVATATGNTTRGEEIEVPVETAIAPAAGGENASAGTRIVHTYDAPDLASLVHDPTIGVLSLAALDPAAEGLVEDLKDVPGPAVLLAVAALGAGAVAARRRG